MSVKIVTEAGRTIGFGHYTRMSSICERLSGLGIDSEILLHTDATAKSVLKSEYICYLNWLDDYNLVFNNINYNDTVIVDCYKIDLDFLKNIQHITNKLIVIDDNNRLSYENMIILNPNYFATDLKYPQNKNNTYFIGGDYTLLRKEFIFNGSREVKQDVSEVMITFGGTDLLNMTWNITNVIKKISPSVQIDVVVTDAFQNVERLKGILSERDRLYINASAETMVELMKNVDFTIAAAGGTSNELIKMQCPALLYVVADNQHLNGNFIKDHMLADVVDDLEIRESDIIKMFDYKHRLQITKKLEKLNSTRTAIDVISKIARS